LTRGCPAGCVVSSTSAKNNLLRAAHSQAPVVTLAFIPLNHYQGPPLSGRQFATQPSSPRAPPIL
jgi:hypothetical protein